MGPAGEELYTSQSYTNDVSLGVRTIQFDSGDAITRTVFPAGVKIGPAFEDVGAAFLNVNSGWAAARRGVDLLMARVIALGAKVVGGKAVTGLVREAGRTHGVTLADGSSIRAGLVVIATGSWTSSTFRELALDEMCTSTG
jgi:sarcosine oxidase / L-pipecolate oxidase